MALCGNVHRDVDRNSAQDVLEISLDIEVDLLKLSDQVGSGSSHSPRSAASLSFSMMPRSAQGLACFMKS